MIAVVHCVYEEGDLESYGGCYVSVHGVPKYYMGSISTRDTFGDDLFGAASWCVKNGYHPFYSSDIDTFQKERHQEYRRSLQ
jgi:hypothetical protein